MVKMVVVVGQYEYEAMNVLENIFYNNNYRFSYVGTNGKKHYILICDSETDAKNLQVNIEKEMGKYKIELNIE